MTVDQKKILIKLLPYFWALLIAVIAFAPNLFLDFRVSDDYHFFRLYNNNELSYVWTHSYDMDGVENDGLRPLFIWIFHFITLIFGFNGPMIYAVAFTVVVTKSLLAVKLGSYFIKNKVLLLASVFLSLTAFDLVDHHYWATEIPSNICTILIFISLIILFNIAKNRFKYLSYIASLILLLLSSMIKEIAVPFLLFPLIMLFYWKKINFINFQSLKNKLVFLVSCLPPILYIIYRMTFFTSTEYQATYLGRLINYIWGIATLFNVQYIYSFYHNFFRPNMLSLSVVFSFNLILLIIGVFAIKNWRKIIGDKFNLLLFSLIIFSSAIFPFTRGWRVCYIYLFFIFIFIGRFIELNIASDKWRKIIIIFMMIMMVSNIYISCAYVYERYYPATSYIYKGDLKIMNDTNGVTKFLLRDEYEIQLEYLKAKINQEKKYFAN